MKSIKEKELLVNIAKLFGQNVDASLKEEVNEHKKLVNNIRDNIRSSIFKDLPKALTEIKQDADKVLTGNNFPLPPSLDNLEIIEEKAPTSPTLTELAFEAIAASAKKDSFQQPDPLLVAPDINSLQKKIRYLEQWLAKVSQAGPGGGASDTSNFTSFTKLVSDNYTIARKDYYVGVNHSSPVTITLPTIAENGHNLVIKDESGNCSINPITVAGNVDNDPNGFILSINNGAIQMIYREGWKII